MAYITDIFKDETISSHGKLVYCCLGMYVDKAGKCWPSTKTIARNSGISRPTVLKAIKELADKGYVKCQNRVSNENQADISNLYYLPRVNEVDRGVKDIDRGCKRDLQTRVNEVDTNLSNINLSKELNSPRNFTDEHLSLATYFQDKIRERKPDYKFAGTIEKWAGVIRLTMERDNRSANTIRAVIEWSQQNSFWQNNILSPDKLRKQFDRLELQMNQEWTKHAKAEKQFDENGICWDT